MSRQALQFAVAVLGMLGLVLGALMAIAGEIWYGGPQDLTFALITALTGVTSMAATYLFRNGGGGSGAGGP